MNCVVSQHRECHMHNHRKPPRYGMHGYAFETARVITPRSSSEEAAPLLQRESTESVPHDTENGQAAIFWRTRRSHAVCPCRCPRCPRACCRRCPLATLTGPQWQRHCGMVQGDRTRHGHCPALPPLDNQMTLIVTPRSLVLKRGREYDAGAHRARISPNGKEETHDEHTRPMEYSHITARDDAS